MTRGVNIEPVDDSEKCLPEGKLLTVTEMKVLRLILDGKSNKEIGNLLHRSIRTIEMHRSKIMQKLGVDNLADLVKKVTAMALFDFYDE